MAKSTRRRVRVDKFKAQLAESVIGEDSLIELEIGSGEFVTIKIPIDFGEVDEFQRAMREAGSDLEAGALVALSGNPDHTAEDQLAKWLAAGLTIEELIRMYSVEATAARERLGEFRYRG